MKMRDYYLYKVNSYLVPQASGQGYLAPGGSYAAGDKGSSVDDLFGSKLDRAKWRIDALVEAIDARRLIREENFYGIERDLCKCQNLLFDLGYRVYARDRQWKDLETRKLDLSREKRGEESAFFRDVTFLGKELRDAVGYHQSLVDRQGVFDVGAEDQNV